MGSKPRPQGSGPCTLPIQLGSLVLIYCLHLCSPMMATMLYELEKANDDGDVIAAIDASIFHGDIGMRHAM